MSVKDLTPGSGHEITEVRLATTLVGLDTATPGAALNLGVEVLGGVGNAAPVYIRTEDATGVVATVIELYLETDILIEVSE